MARKRGPGRPKGSGKKKKETKQHVLPGGFWRQVGAVFLVIFGIIAFLGLLDIGGSFPVGLAGALLWLIGWAAFVMPFLFLWQAVQIFRAEENRISPVTWFATAFFLWFSAGIAQLFLDDPTRLQVSTEPLTGQGGGFLGWLIDAQIFAGAFDTPVMAFILVVLCLVLLMFVLAITPSQIINGIKKLFGREKDPEGEKKNKEIARMAEAEEAKGPSKIIRNNAEPKLAPMLAKATPNTSPNDSDWVFPGVNLLNKAKSVADPGDIEKNGQTIIDTLAQFDIKVIDDVVANIGPRITQYAFRVKSGTRMKHVASLDNEFRSALKAEQVRVEAPIPGKQEVGIEVPNSKIANVLLSDLFNEPEWVNRSEDSLLIAVGRDTNNKAIFVDLADSSTCNMLVAGQAGSGKSVLINSLLMSLLYSKKPSELKLILADPKRVELERYKDIPHLITPIITDVSKDPTNMLRTLTWAISEMQRRYQLFSEESVLNIVDYNNKVRQQKKEELAEGEEALTKLPQIVVVIDEVSNLMMNAGKDVEKLIIDIVQMGRAAGLHVILATQRPDQKTVPGLIKANIQVIVAFAVSNYVQSNVVIGTTGAEKLLGKGDMLLQTADSSVLRRIQGANVDNDEVNKVSSFIKVKNGPADYDPEVLATNVQSSGRGGVVMGGGGRETRRDALFEEVAQFAIDNGSLTTNSIAVNFDVGNPRAARIMIQLEKSGVVGPKNGTKPREVLVSSLDALDEIE